MEKFNVLKSTVVPIDIENIDTDQIIPARFLKVISREGFGDNLFRDWRYDSQGNPIDSFILNNSSFKGKILIARRNFGCGSSREHAAWALYDYGFKCVISSFFADIFKQNALNNSLLPVQVSESFLNQLFDNILKHPETEIEIDLPKQRVTLILENSSIIEPFEINEYKKECLLKGYKDIDFLLSKKEKILEYEKNLKSP